MKKLLRSSAITVLVVGSLAGIAASTNSSNAAKTPNLGTPGLPQPDQCFCVPGGPRPTTNLQ